MDSQQPSFIHPSGPPRPAESEPGWFDWAYKGVDHSLPGNGGLECRDFLSFSQRCWESAIASLVGLFALLYAYPRLRLPVACPSRYANGEPLGKRILLLLMCLTFGIELGFKFSTRRVIWLGNPCHLATIMQIFIMVAPPSRIVTAAFRLHMHMLTGAPIAILFPVINARLLPFETGVYFLQHMLLLVIPFYLMKTGDPFIPEDLLDFKWAFCSFGFLYLYHFLPLQILAYHSLVNLNNMLCPAVSDPFHGKYYRLFAIGHQILLIPTLGKVFVIIAKACNILPCNNLADAPLKQVFSCEQENKKCLSASPPPCCPGGAPPSEASCCDFLNSNVDSGISNTCVENPERECCSDTLGRSVDSSVCNRTCGNSSVQCKKECVRDDMSYTYGASELREENSVLRNPDIGSVATAPSSVNSCGQGDSGCQNYVTRRLVNGRVTNGQQSSCRPNSQPAAQSCASSNKATGDCTKNGGQQMRSRNSSGGCDGGGRRHSDSRGPMSMSELSGSNGHAKGH